MNTEVKENWRFKNKDDVSFKDMFDFENDLEHKAPAKVHVCTVLLLVVNRNNPTETLMETEAEVYFYNERNWLGGQNHTSYYDTGSINYWVRNRALSYFCNLNYKDKPEDVKKFIEVTKNKTWGLDSMIIKTEEKYWDGKKLI